MSRSSARAHRADTIVYTEKGAALCVCPATGEARDLAFMVYEHDRGSVKYRCPAAARVRSDGRWDAGGVWAHRPGCLEDRYRIFIPTPRSSPSSVRAYNKRTVVERFNARIDNVFGFEDHTIRGIEKMRTRMGLALVVALAMPVDHLMEGRASQILSFLCATDSPTTEAAAATSGLTSGKAAQQDANQSGEAEVRLPIQPLCRKVGTELKHLT